MAEREHLILYIDDDADYRLAVRQLLEANGLRMVEAPDGEAGFRAFREHKPDLVIVDLMMEEIDSGVNFMREVRGTGSKTPVYLMSSVADSLATTTNASDLGFAGVVQKPFGKDWLMAIVRAHFAK
ncbi:MAG: response regulator [Phycisphaerales bacterium]